MDFASQKRRKLDRTVMDVVAKRMALLAPALSRADIRNSEGMERTEGYIPIPTQNSILVRVYDNRSRPDQVFYALVSQIHHEILYLNPLYKNVIKFPHLESMFTDDGYNPYEIYSFFQPLENEMGVAVIMLAALRMYPELAPHQLGDYVEQVQADPDTEHSRIFNQLLMIVSRESPPLIGFSFIQSWDGIRFKEEDHPSMPNAVIPAPHIVGLPMQNYASISGTYSLTEHYSQKLGMHIYIFGDEHEKKPTGCKDPTIPINQFLRMTVEWMKQQNQPLDVFIEYETVTQTKPQRQYDVLSTYSFQWIKTVWQEFDPYLQRRTRPKSQLSVEGRPSNKGSHQMAPPRITEDIRFHAVDIRMADKDMTEMMRAALSVMWHVPGAVFDRRLTDSWLPLTRERFDRLLAVTRIDRQVARIASADIRGVIVKIFETELQRQADALTMVFDTEKWTGWLALLMDYYCMARMFRAYRPKNSTQKSPRTLPVRNAIIFVGDEHAETQRTVLYTLGFQTVATSLINNDNLCIPLDGFVQPFFSHVPAPPSK